MPIVSVTELPCQLIEIFCPYCGIGATLAWDGIEIPTVPVSYRHVCAICNYEELYENVPYPRYQVALGEKAESDKRVIKPTCPIHYEPLVLESYGYWRCGKCVYKSLYCDKSNHGDGW
jgi:hypothetical protein